MSNKKELRHNIKSCGQVFEICETEQGLPYLKCECGARIEDWVKWETTYKNVWENEQAWGSKKDHIVCLLGYFANLYHKHYSIAFTFSLNDGGLFRGPECHLIRKIYTQFGSDAIATKAYLDWIFDAKVQQRKKRITSLAFLATAAIIQEFKLKQQKSRVISRSSPLPPKMLEWVDKFVPDIKNQVSLRDFGELHTLLTYYKDGHFRDSESVVKLIKKLQDTNYVGPEFNIINWRE